MKVLASLSMLLLCASFVVSPALAADDSQGQGSATVYAKADIANLMLAMLRSGALEPTDPLVRDDYLLSQECGLYRANYTNEFQMRRLQEAAGKSIQLHRAGWPNAFTFETPLRLDRYDFKEEQYLFETDSKLVNVNSFVLLRASDIAICLPGKQLRRFPDSVAVRIDQPVSLPGIPLPPRQAEALVQRLTANGTLKNKQIYARFMIAVSFMPPIDAMLQPGEAKPGRYTFDGRLMQVQFFEDAAYTKPIWTLTR